MNDGEVSPVTSILQSVLPGSDSALCGLNADGCLTWVNETFEVLANRRREDMLARPLARLFEPAEQRSLAEVFARVLVDGERIRGHQTRLRRAGGGTEIIQVSGMPVTDTGDGTVVVVALERASYDMRQPTGSGADPLREDAPPRQILIQTGMDGNCIHVSEDWYLLTGCEAATLLGQPLMSALRAEYRTPELLALVSRFDGQPRIWQGQVCCVGAEESMVPVKLLLAQLVDAAGRFAGVSACFWQLPSSAQPNTGVRDAVGQYRLDARRPGQMVYDYDVASGDVRWNGAILQITGERPERFRGTDLNDWEQRIHPEDQPLIMERLRQALESGSSYRIGYRLKRHDGTYLQVEERATVLRNARGIAYRMLGTIRVQTARDLSQQAGDLADRPYLRSSLAEEELGWVERISRALKEDRMHLYHQRTFRSLDQSPDRSEIFLRMLDEQGELLPAGTFLPPAMRCNLMPLLDRWVIRTVCETLAQRNDPTLSVCVNLAPGSLMDGSFADFVERQFAEHGLEAGTFAFEIVESAVATSGAVTAFMRHMRGLGCRIILDNVGGGLCSLGYLRGLPVDVFKIDGGFIRHLMDDPVDVAIVESIVKVGKTMGVSLMAQGVEDTRVLGLLKDMGVETVQGMALHAPEPWDVQDSGSKPA
ncbi:MAG: EAL domain-containing protein [Aquisalimonadaceae bacterium]